MFCVFKPLLIKNKSAKIISAVFLVFPFIFSPGFALALDGTLSGYVENGERSTAEDYEEEGTDDDYTYRNYHLKFEQKASERLRYDISTFVYDKDYDTKDALDNISRVLKINWSYDIEKRKEESVELDCSLKYREKRFENSPRNEYDQFTLAPTLSFIKKDTSTLNLSAGVNNFDYLSQAEKDQSNVFAKAGGKRYLLDKRLLLSASYRIEQAEQDAINREKTKRELMGGVDYVFDLPWLYKITNRLNWGQRDTKDEEDRDEDFDYEYWRAYTKTEHRINPKLKTDLKYQYFKKDYVSADLDHHGFSIHNSWDYEIFDDETRRIWLGLGFEHKDVDYTLRNQDNYKKETAGITAHYQKKKNWKTSLSLEENFYNYNDAGSNRERLYTKLAAEKLFREGDVKVSIEFKYRYTDYEERNDANQNAVRLGFEYKF